MKKHNFEILLVEDNELDAHLVELSLSSINEKLSLVWVENGAKCLEYLRVCPSPPSLVILDLKMPGMDGFDVLESIRKENLKKFPVVIFSGSNLSEDSLRAFQLGADDFFQKPYDFLETKVMFHAILNKWMVSIA
ncbi:MAG: response regulator [Bacteroidota bacterium]